MTRTIRIMGLMLAFLLALGLGSANKAAAQAGSCDLSGTVSGSVSPTSGSTGSVLTFRATGFTGGEAVSFFFTAPDQTVFGTNHPISGGVNSDGTVGPLPLQITADLVQKPGTWAITFVGATSHHQAIIKFCVLSTAPPPTCDLSGTVSGTANPTSGNAGDTITFTATGFNPGEDLSFFFTLPNGQVAGTAQPIPNGVGPSGTVGPIPFPIPASFAQFPGTWAITFVGASSHHQAIIKFCIGVSAQAQPTNTPAPAATNTTAPVPTDTVVAPTAAATNTAGAAPTDTVAAPTAAPTNTAGAAPTDTVAAPTAAPTNTVSAPTAAPTNTTAPTAAPTETAVPTANPTSTPMGTTGGQPPGMPRSGASDLSGLFAALIAGLLLISTGLVARRRLGRPR